MKHLTLALLLGTTALPATAGEIWVTNEKDDTISVIDTDTLEVTRTIETGERPRGITFSKDYSVVYICASDSDTVQVMDPNTGEVLHNLPSGEDPEQFVLHPNDRHLYIANEDDAVTTVVDTETRQVIAQINVGIEPEGMAVSPDGAYAITTSETTNMAHWIDTETRKIVANTLVDSRPRHAEFAAGGSELWVSAEIGGTVSIFDVESKAEKGKIKFEVKGVHPTACSPWVLNSPKMRKPSSLRWGRQTTSPWSMPKPMRSKITFWSGAVSGTWISTATSRICSPPTGCRAM